MRNINEYLIRKGKHITQYDGFPIENDKDLIIEFLEDHNFTNVNPKTFSEFCDMMLKTKDPVYWVGSHDESKSSWIRFTDDGDYDEKTIFLVMTSFDHAQIDGSHYHESFSSCEKFAEAVNKWFGW